MKTKHFFTTAAVSALLLIASFNVNAQPRQERQRGQDKVLMMDQCIPGLTEEQKTKINDLRTAHMKEVTPVKNVLAEKQARLNTLTAADKSDMVEVNKTIDEIAKLKGDLMKMRVSHQAKVKALLTDEQKVYFNAHMSRKMGKGMGMKAGMHKGKGMHQGDGMGNGMGKGMRHGQHTGAMECEKMDTTK